LPQSGEQIFQAARENFSKAAKIAHERLWSKGEEAISNAEKVLGECSRIGGSAISCGSLDAALAQARKSQEALHKDLFATPYNYGRLIFLKNAEKVALENLSAAVKKLCDEVGYSRLSAEIRKCIDIIENSIVSIDRNFETFQKAGMEFGNIAKARDKIALASNPRKFCELIEPFARAYQDAYAECQIAQMNHRLSRKVSYNNHQIVIDACSEKLLAARSALENFDFHTKTVVVACQGKTFIKCVDSNGAEDWLPIDEFKAKLATLG